MIPGSALGSRSFTGVDFLDLLDPVGGVDADLKSCSGLNGWD